MKAVVFGAGKIARGFVGQILYMSGFAITFIDVNKDLIEHLRASGHYHVHVLGDASLDSDVTNYEAISLDRLDEIAQKLFNADIAFVSVGGKNLESVGKVIAEAINRWTDTLQHPLNFITCENYANAGAILKEAIQTNLYPEKQNLFAKWIGVAESVVMRTATIPDPDLLIQEPLSVWVQNYWNLPVDDEALKGEIPEIVTLMRKKHFGHFLIQKMYTNNTSNAVIAYTGYLLGYNILSDAANSPEISKLLDLVYDEINELVIAGLHVDPKDQYELARKAREKYTDPVIVDQVIRHAKDPLRKLGPNDRLIAPARMSLSLGFMPKTIIATIAKALFFDEKSDESAQKLTVMRKTYGIPYVLKNVCCLSETEPLFALVCQAVDQLRLSGLLAGHE